jgi:hypothetical protein
MRRACCQEIAVSADLVTLVTRAGRGGCLKAQPLPIADVEFVKTGSNIPDIAKRVRYIAPLRFASLI